MNHWTRRLPRSNAPHPGESLCGYLLNLAHRLQFKPADLLTRTGLKTSPNPRLLDLQYAISLPEDAQHRFSTATGLTRAEVIDMTIQRYDGVIFDLANPGSHARTLHSNQWVTLGRTRYCPECLQDTRPDDPDHAVWRVEWMTAWTVACSRHQRLLLDACPACQIPVGDPGRGYRSAVPNINHPVAHPAACRAIVGPDPAQACGTRLDHATATEAPSDLLILQSRLDRVLNGTTVEEVTLGVPVAPAQWLQDLRLAIILLQLSRDLDVLKTAPAPLADAAIRFVQQRRPNARAGDTANRTATQPPAHTPAAAGLLLAAAHLLSHEEQTLNLNGLSRLALHHEREPWKKIQATSRPSDGLHHAIKHLKQGITDPRKIRAYTRATGDTFTASNVPAYLDQETYARHFSDIAPRHERPIRRAVPIALTRLVTDCDPATAGRLLGYEESLTQAACARASDGFDTIGHTEFRKRVAAIATELDALPRIDYRNRRDQFTAAWLIPDDAWASLQQTLLTERLARADTPWERRRPAYAAWMWALVTGGDMNTAPMIQDVVNGRLCTNGVAKDISDLIRRTPAPHHKVVHDLAEAIATRLDTELLNS